MKTLKTKSLLVVFMLAIALVLGFSAISAHSNNGYNNNRQQPRINRKIDDATRIKDDKAILAAKLKDKTITQAQYDQGIKDLDSYGYTDLLRRYRNQDEQPVMGANEKAARIAIEKAHLKVLLDSKEITQSKYDELIKKAEAGEFGLMAFQNNRGSRGRGMGQRMFDVVDDATRLANDKAILAAKLKDKTITQAQYDQAIKDLQAGGHSDLLRMRGQQTTMGENEKAARLAAAKSNLKVLLEKKVITQSEYDQRLNDLQSNGFPMRSDMGRGQQRGRHCH